MNWGGVVIIFVSWMLRSRLSRFDSLKRETCVIPPWCNKISHIWLCGLLEWKKIMLWHVFGSLMKLRNKWVPSNYGVFLGLRSCRKKGNSISCKGHFTHETRAVTMKLWEPKRKCPEAIPIHLQNHVVWSPTLHYSVKSCMLGFSTICYFDKILFTHILAYDKNKNKSSTVVRCSVPWSPIFVLDLPPRGGSWKQFKRP